MSEHQVYEFVALDRPLTSKEMAALRAISTRADITPTRFWNEYHWGDLKADPEKLLARYFDAHLYSANWGTRRLMFRLPAARVSLRELKPYFSHPPVKVVKRGAHVIIDLCIQPDEPEDDTPGHAGLGELTSLRSDLLHGDLRLAYLAWLASAQAGELDDGDEEPKVPAGLAALSAPLAGLVEFLGLDPDWVRAAAEGDVTAHDERSIKDWITALPAREKVRWLMRAVDSPEATLSAELRAAFNKAVPSQASRPRTVAALRSRADDLCATRERAQAQRAARAQAVADAARDKRLAKLRRRGDAAWSQLDKLVDARRYDGAVELALDLRELAVRDDTLAAFEHRFEMLRKMRARRRGFFDALKRRAP